MGSGVGWGWAKTGPSAGIASTFSIGGGAAGGERRLLGWCGGQAIMLSTPVINYVYASDTSRNNLCRKCVSSLK